MPWSVLVFVAGLMTSVFATEMAFTKIGPWSQHCEAGESACSAGQFLESPDDYQIYIKILFYLDEHHDLHMKWVSPKLASDEIVYALDGRQLGNLFAQKCDANTCEGSVAFSNEEKQKTFAAHQIIIELQLRADSGVRFPIEAVELEKALTAPKN